MKIKEVYIKWVFLLLFIATLISIHLVDGNFYPTIWELSTTGNFIGTVDYLQSFGYKAIIMSIIIDILINVVGFLPSIFISTANGIVFGIIPGIFISWFAETVGVIISFAFMRTLFREGAKKLIAKNNMIAKLDEYSTMKTMLIARAVPYSPNGLVTALGALSRISYRDYIIGCALGKFPSVAIEVVVGHDAVMYEENIGRLVLVIGGTVIIYGALWLMNRKKKEK